MSPTHDHKTPNYNKLYLDKKNGKISGVCAGMADYFGVDPTILRIGFLVALFCFPPVIFIGYFLFAWMLDPKPGDLYHDEKEGEFWKNVRVKPRNTIRDVRYKFRDIERRLRAAEAHITSSEYKLHKEFRDLENGK